MTITSSMENKRPLALKKVLQEASVCLPPDALILILTQSKEEANKVNNYIQNCKELALTMNLNNVHYGPLGSPPVNKVFSLVVYYAMPKKVEQLFSQMSLLLNTFLYRNYGKKLSKLNVIHFHLLNDSEEYANSRLQAFMKAVSELQLRRMMSSIRQSYEVSKENPRVGTAVLKMSQLCKECDLQPQGIIRVIRQCQGDGLIDSFQMTPCTIRLRFGKPGNDLARVSALQQRSVLFKENYLVSVEDAMEVLNCPREADLHLALKGLQAEEQLFFEVEDEKIVLKLSENLLREETGYQKSLYKKLLAENMTECRLLQFMYLIMRIGSSNIDMIFNKKMWNKNLISLLKHYALAEESSIKSLFPENAVREILEDVKATNLEMDDAAYFYAQLLGPGNTYYPQELEACKEELGSAEREFMRIQLVKTLLDLPGSRRPEVNIHSQFTPAAFRKIDFESLLHVADQALANHSRSGSDGC